jgi:hypothetical protein
LLLQPAALAEEQHGLGRDRRQQVHHRGRVGAAHAEVDHGDAVERGTLGIGRSRPRTSPPPMTRREHVDVAAEIGQQDVLAEFVRAARRCSAATSC